MSSKRLYNSPLPAPSVLFLSLTGHLPKPFPPIPFPNLPFPCPEVSVLFCYAEGGGVVPGIPLEATKRRSPKEKLLLDFEKLEQLVQLFSNVKIQDLIVS